MLATPPIPSHVYTTQGVLDTPCWLHHQFHHTCIQHKVCWTRHAGYTSSSITDTTQDVLHVPSWLHLQFHHRYNTRYTAHAKLHGYTSSSTTPAVLDMPRWLHLQFHHKSIQHEACCTYQAGYTSSSTRCNVCWLLVHTCPVSPGTDTMNVRWAYQTGYIFTSTTHSVKAKMVTTSFPSQAEGVLPMYNWLHGQFYQCLRVLDSCPSQA